jgi:hypothetical protein
MPRNFDELREAKDLAFVLGGQTFSLHLLPLPMIGVWTEREADVKTDDTDAFTQMCVDRIADAVADGNGSEERWRELCKSDKAPSYGELLELARWAWEAQSDLPTMEPSPSQPGRGTTAVSSKGA